VVPMATLLTPNQPVSQFHYLAMFINSAELSSLLLTVLRCCLVVPVATLITPNQFEAEQLTGLSIRTQADAIAACDMLHAAGPRKVVITSMEVDGRLLVVGSDASSPAAEEVSELTQTHQDVRLLLVVGSGASIPAAEQVSERAWGVLIWSGVEVWFELTAGHAACPGGGE
ncbi:unnamed protein product, partial [Closterium sp. NIES-53]